MEEDGMEEQEAQPDSETPGIPEPAEAPQEITASGGIMLRHFGAPRG